MLFAFPPTFGCQRKPSALLDKPTAPPSPCEVSTLKHRQTNPRTRGRGSTSHRKTKACSRRWKRR
jgi:hypothetical protein